MTIKKYFSQISKLSDLTDLGYLNATQFLGAMNDNIFKLLIVFYFIGIEGEAASNAILSSVGALYVLPFLILSSTAGTMADRYSKKSIIVCVKVVECFVMLLGLISFLIASKFLAYTALFFLACHSTIFAPCKYGIVPEIVEKEKISKANGLISSCTYIAIIVGTFLASFLTDITGRNFLVATSCAFIFALTGFFFSKQISYTEPSGSDKKISPRFITELFRNLKLINNEPSLLSAVIGSSFFLFIGSYVQLNMIPFALRSLSLTDVQGGYLFLMTALGIGLGSLLSGKLAGKRVELGLVPIGGLGMSLCAVLISQLTDYLYTEIFLITLLGLFSGLYLVPLDTYIQVASPKTLRGQVIATTNFLGFFGVLLSAGMLYFLGEILDLKPSTGFLVIGIFSTVFVTSISIAISAYFIRYFSMLRMQFTYKVKLEGVEKIDENLPSIYFSTLSPKPWTTFLTAIQPKRICIVTVENQARNNSYLRRFLDRLLFRYYVEKAQELNPDTEMGEFLKKQFLRGTSIAFFAKNPEEILFIKTTWLKEYPQFPFSVFELSGKSSDNRYELQLT